MRNLQVFLPHESHECSYLPEKRSRSLYIDPRQPLSVSELTALNRQGFRRSGQLVYRPQCERCNACQSARVVSHKARLTRSQRKIIKRNKDLTLAIESPVDAAMHYPLFETYIEQRHADGDMYPPSFDQYKSFLLEDFGNTRFLCAYKGERLVASLAFDILEDGLSSVYCFFDPDEARRSPATFLILSLTRLSQLLGLHYNYLGYFVDGCQKMAYKTQFSAIELLQQQEWRRLVE